MSLAPIVLFVYNRPWHTKQTVESLQNNYLAKDSLLFIYSDGARAIDDKEEVNKVREYIKTIEGFKEVKIIEREKNLGLANSVIAGVTEVINKYGKVIVLEDDMLSSPNFLNFMNDALDFYKDEKRVFSISGYVYPYKKVKKYPYDVFIFPRASTWGWGTWFDRWEKADWDIRDYEVFIKDEKQISSFNRGGDDLSNMLKNQMNGKIDSWGIRWCYAHYKNNATSIFPIISKIQNIGNDNSGVHCELTQKYIVKLDCFNKLNFKFVDVLNEDIRITGSIRNFFKNHSTQIKIKNKIKQSVIWKIYKKLKRLNQPIQKEFRKLKRKYKNIKRFIPIEIKFQGIYFYVPDVPSFIWQVKEIFLDNGYKFNTRKNNPIIYDCGANIGTGTIYIKKLYPNSIVKAYEPDRKIFDILQRNIKKNIINDVILINKAIWINEKGVMFSSEGADGGSIYGEWKNCYKVETVRLKTEIEKEEYIDFLKMDIEGAEVDVIKDCRDVLNKIGHIFIEYHSWNKKEQSLGEILNILKNNGFRYYLEPVLIRKQPFINTAKQRNMDLQINIFGYKE